MTRKQLVLGVSAAVLIAAGGGYWLGQSAVRDMNMPASSGASSGAPAKPGDIDPKTGKRILYWTDPMIPGFKSDKPGKSPMNMEMVPVYADEGGDKASSAITIDGSIRQSLAIRTAPVSQGSLAPKVRAVGTVAFNERSEAVLQSRISGYVQRLFVKATFDRVRRGQTVVTVTSPEWARVQEEYLALRRAPVPGVDGLVAAARQRMRLAGMTDAQIAAVSREGRADLGMAIPSPVNGVVTELAVREGMAVAPGQTLARIASLDPIWIDVAVPEGEAALLKPSDSARIETVALPGQTFQGRVLALLPQVSPETRTRSVRVEVDNPRQLLVPGMTADVTFTPGAGRPALLVPTEAVIRTGTRAIVFVYQGKGRFVPTQVTVGREAGGRTEILSGLRADDRVVASGQFLIDSEASLRGIEARVSTRADAPPDGARSDTKRAAQEYEGAGLVEAIEPNSVTISHEPVPALQWPAMTMTFTLREGAAAGVKPGMRIRFRFVMDAQKGATVTQILPAGQENVR